MSRFQRAEADPRVDIQASLERASSYNRWIGDQARAVVGMRVLDAGCGAGNITRQLLDREQVVAVDVWDEFVDSMTREFAGAPNLAIHRFDLADPEMSDALLEYDLDSAICANVLEHVEDHRAALTNIAAALRPGSPIFLLVPAFQMLFGEHDRADRHFRRYTKRSLRETVRPLALNIEESRYMNLPGFFAWFVLARLLRRRLTADAIGFCDPLGPLISATPKRMPPP